MKRAIVLSGGGAKGAYQMGVWKALRRLDIKYDIVTGSSVGSLLGVLMVQGDYLKAFKTWYYMDYKKVMDIEIKGRFNTKSGREEIIKKYAKGAISGGFEMLGLEKVIDDALDENKFFSSDVNYGLVTTYFPSLKGKYVKKENLKPGDLKQYLLASCSCFPAFKPTKIGNSMFIDGGYYDNLPINLAIELGADEIIAIDLGSVGFVKPVKNKKVNITYIRPNNDLGNFLVFEKGYARASINLGYNDTMKLYGKLEGEQYTFKKSSLKRNYDRNKDRFYKLYEEYLNNMYNRKTYKNIKGKNKELYFNKLIEKTAKAFSIDPTKIYRTSFLNILIKKEFLKTKVTNHLTVKNILKNNKSTKTFISKELICYIYDVIKNNRIRTIKSLALLFPESFLCALYLKTIMR